MPGVVPLPLSLLGLLPCRSNPFTLRLQWHILMCAFVCAHMRRMCALQGEIDKLREAGCAVLGSEDSPVIPIMIFHPAKIPAISRECYKYGVAIVVVGFPATPLLLARARLCISAAHSRKDLEYACDVLIQASQKCAMTYNGSTQAKLKG